MKAILSLIILAVSINVQVWAQEVCIEEKSESLQELHKVVEKLSPGKEKLSKEFCWIRRVCDESVNDEEEKISYNFSSKSMPKNFSCSAQDKAKYSTMKKLNCGMSADERMVIDDYSTSAYHCMNAYLRQKGQSNKDIDKYIQTLNQALDKLPNYEGIVIRGALLPEKIEAQHTKGNIVTYEAFTSTSTGEALWGQDRFIIFSKTGKPIMGLSSLADENEILFKSGTKFKILEVMQDKHRKVFIMKEVSCAPGSAQEEEEDAALIKRIKDQNNKLDEGWKADAWSCPDNEKSVPVQVKQKNLPKVGW